MLLKKFLFFVIMLICSMDSWATEDEIVFFNVGQGHCTLVRKVGHVPLLIDGGSKQNVHRVLKEQSNYAGSERGVRVLNSIIAKITEYWDADAFHNGVLNVIVTHGDADHVNYVPTILERLRQGRNFCDFRLLLGGTNDHYETQQRDYNLELAIYQPYYSADIIGQYNSGQFVKWAADSGCITHLFCPYGKVDLVGKAVDPNTWSIITRVEFTHENSSLSAILTGDAEEAVQRQMLSTLGPLHHHEILSDILLYPHHGAKKLDYRWKQMVNPKAIVISAGNYQQFHHPKKEALASLLTFHPVGQNLITQMQTLTINGRNLVPSERLWNSVDTHQIVYYDPEGQFASALRNILPKVDFSFRDNTTLTTEPYIFNDEPWYITLEPGWKCAHLNFPIYTTYTSGTMVFKRAPLDLNNFHIEFTDIPTDTEKMAQIIQGNFIDEDRQNNRIGDLTDDKGEDYEDLFRLAPITIQNTFDALQLFIINTPGKPREVVIKHAGEIFFLCFNIIPNIETKGSKKKLKRFRDTYLVQFINYFRDVTENINFEQGFEKNFFNSVIECLFAKSITYKNFNIPRKFNHRICIFDSFVRSTHYNDAKRREDWLYLYCLIYKALPLHRPQFVHPHMANIVSSLSVVPFWSREKSPPQNGLEDSLNSAQYIYDQCSGSNTHFKAKLEEMPELVRTIHTLNLESIDTENIAKFLSWFPYNFSVPISEAVSTISPFCHNLNILTEEEFEALHTTIANTISFTPTNEQPKILRSSLIKTFPTLKIQNFQEG